MALGLPRDHLGRENPPNSGCPGGQGLPVPRGTRGVPGSIPRDARGPAGFGRGGGVEPGLCRGFCSVLQPPGSDLCFLTARAARPEAPLCNGAILVAAWPGHVARSCESTGNRRCPTPGPGARPPSVPQPPQPLRGPGRQKGDKAPVVPGGGKPLQTPLLWHLPRSGGSLRFGRRNPRSEPLQRVEICGNCWEGQKLRGALVKVWEGTGESLELLEGPGRAQKRPGGLGEDLGTWGQIWSGSSSSALLCGAF